MAVKRGLTPAIKTAEPNRESFVSLLLSKARAKGDGEEDIETIIRNTAALTYIGAMDTVGFYALRETPS